MENKTLGIIGLVLVGIYMIFSFLDINDALEFLPSFLSIETISISLLLVGAGCWLLSNDEHVIFAYVDFVVAILFIIFCIGISFIPEENILELVKVIAYVFLGVIFILLLNVPLLVRTQSQIHRAIKYFTILLMVAFVILNLSSSSLSLLGGTSLTDMSFINSGKGISRYILVLIEVLLIANPMVAVATSDGLGGGKSKTPKLVARNQATDPNMAHNSTIQTEGINYGGMPVPDGVVANQNFNAIPNDNLNQYVSPEIVTTPTENVVVTDSQPVTQETLEPTPVAEPTPVVSEQVVTPSTQPIPTNSMNSDDVAAELQSLTNNNQ